jgi:ketosteroid isomerase-like protein
MDPADVVRSYYATVDEHDYDALYELLGPDFVHDRPDRTIKGRDRFVAFMRDERPNTETTHELAEVYANGVRTEFVVRGELLDADGEPLFAFADVHAVDGGLIESVLTFVRRDGSR